MTTIPPRLTRLMEILLDAGSPEMVTDLAKRCGVSRRTVFREIKDIDALVKPYGLTISTKMGEGVFLEGEAAGRERLRSLVGGRIAARPVDADERRVLLLLGLLTFGDVQKLQSYARSFGVSSATLSHDLDHLAERLAARDVHIVRRPGFGVGVQGDELSIRRAIYATLLAAECKNIRTQSLLGYPPPDIADGVHQLMTTRFAPHLTWMTEESRQALAVCLVVITDRLVHGGPITGPGPDAPGELLPIADFFADSLELMFGVDFTDAVLMLAILKKKGRTLARPPLNVPYGFGLPSPVKKRYGVTGSSSNRLRRPLKHLNRSNRLRPQNPNCRPPRRQRLPNRNPHLHPSRMTNRRRHSNWKRSLRLRPRRTTRRLKRRHFPPTPTQPPKRPLHPHQLRKRRRQSCRLIR